MGARDQTGRAERRPRRREVHLIIASARKFAALMTSPGHDAMSRRLPIKENDGVGEGLECRFERMLGLHDLADLRPPEFRHAAGGSGGLPAGERELAATSLIGVEQLTETVHEFLDLTRIEAGELRLNLEPVHLPSLLLEVIGHAEAQATARGIVVRSSVAP